MCPIILGKKKLTSRFPADDKPQFSCLKIKSPRITVMILDIWITEHKGK